MSFRIFNVASRGKIDLHWSQRILEHCQQTFCASDPLAPNYTETGLDLASHLSFDVLVDQEDDIVTFCGVYSADRYPEGVFRVLNRTYVAPKYRAQGKLFEGLTSKYLLPYQMEALKNEISFAFVSRESLQARHFLRRWIVRNAPQKGWMLSDQLIHVAPKSHRKSAYQYIAYRSFREVKWNPQAVNSEQWLQLPD